MKNLGALLTAGFLVVVQCKLFDKPEFKVGGLFTLTCDIDRIGSVPTDVSKIMYLSISRFFVSGKEDTAIASYTVVGSENVTKNIPSGRKWEIKASGGRGANLSEVNRGTIKLTLHVSDAQCSDTGLYSCLAIFIPTHGLNNLRRNDTLSSKGVPVLKLEESSGHASLNKTSARLTCHYEGIEGLALSWLTRPIGGTKLLPYPSNDDIKMVTPTFNKESFECGKYMSTLTFKPPEVDTLYICVVKDGEKELGRNSYKFIVKAANTGMHIDASNTAWFLRDMFLVMSVSAIFSCP